MAIDNVTKKRLWQNKNIFCYPKLIMLVFAIASLSGLGISKDSFAVTASATISVSNYEFPDTVPYEGTPRIINEYINITTNNSSGFILSLSSKTGDTRLRGESTTNSLWPIEASSALDDFTSNSWGYCFGEQECNIRSIWNPIKDPNNADVVAKEWTTDGWNAVRTYSLGYAAKVDLNTDADTYTNQQLLSFVAIDEAFATITTMQEMTASVCAAEPTPAVTDVYVPTKQLIDVRDDKKYWVAKLADGNCWMTQNLALDLSTSITLTPYDTDIVANWTPPRNTDRDMHIRIGHDRQVRSWNFGQYVVAEPNSGEQVCDFTQTFADCLSLANDRLVDVSTWRDTYLAYGSSTDMQNIDADKKTYDAHFLLGNYYSWQAATAGTGQTTFAEEPTGSICPKGWQLPGGTSLTTGDFVELLGVYAMLPGWVRSPESINKLASSPVYLFRGGDVYTDTGSGFIGGNYGIAGMWWTKTAMEGDLTNTGGPSYIMLYGNSTHIRSEGGKSYGMSVRCFAPSY